MAPFGEFHASVQGKLLRVAQARTRSLRHVVDGEDLVQEAFLALFHKLRPPGSVEIETPFKWLVTVVMNRARDLWDREKPRRDERRHQCGRMKGGLGHLTSRERRVLYFCDTLGFTVLEAAEVLSMSPTNVSTTRYAAKMKLKKFFGDGQ
jgi:DNA-directed RNA polymerase specialized sigma24 family protein